MNPPDTSPEAVAMMLERLKDTRGPASARLDAARMIQAMVARAEAAEERNQDLLRDSGQICGCGYDNPGDICLGHFRKFQDIKDRAEAAEAKASALRNAQSYTYIGVDGKPVLARDLEDRAIAAEAALDLYEDAIQEAEAIFGGEYADDYGPMFELALKARDARAAIKGDSHG